MQPIYVLPDAFTRDQARRFRDLAEETGFAATGAAYPPSYRNNDRVVRDDPALARELYDAMAPHLPRRMTDADGHVWQLAGLNERFRFCRYRDGQQFGIHRDGVFHRDERTRSMLTFMIYLNDAGEFEGGHTRFYRGSDPSSGLLMSMAPQCGTLIVFDHALWHDGAPVTNGTKYVMRSDVVYERTERTLTSRDSHLGYVWALAALPHGRIASAGRDGTVRVWAVAGDALESRHVLPRHGGSVSALTADADGYLWTGTRRGHLRAFDASGTALATHDAQAGAILAMAPAHDAGVVVATARGTIEMWTRRGRIHAFPAHTGWVWDVMTMPGGDLISAGEDGRVRRWRPDGSRATTLCDAGSPVRCLARVACADDDIIAAGCADGSLLLLPASGPGTRITAHVGAIRAIAIGPDHTLITAGEDARVHTWRLRDLGWLHTETHDDFVTSLLTLDDGRVISAGYDGQILVWPQRARETAARSAM